MPRLWNFVKKETQIQEFSCELSELFTEHLRVDAPNRTVFRDLWSKRLDEIVRWVDSIHARFDLLQ